MITLILNLTRILIIIGAFFRVRDFWWTWRESLRRLCRLSGRPRLGGVTGASSRAGARPRGSIPSITQTGPCFARSCCVMDLAGIAPAANAAFHAALRLSRTTGAPSRTSSSASRFDSLYNTNRTVLRTILLCYGPGGNRTRVRKSVHTGISHHSHLKRDSRVRQSNDKHNASGSFINSVSPSKLWRNSSLSESTPLR